jgi:hypothetical protein
MDQQIIAQLGEPRELEHLYRSDPARFARAFNRVYPMVQEHLHARVWHERLNYRSEPATTAPWSTLLFVLVACFFAGLLAKLPELLSLEPEHFYPRNIGFILFPFLAAYFIREQGSSLAHTVGISAAMLVAVVYINLLPDMEGRDSVILACIHLPLFLWALLGIAFAGGHPNDHLRKADFLRYNGDLLVMTVLILIAGVLLTGLTVGLFQLIDLDITTFYLEYVVVWGLASAPIVATHLVRTDPQLVNKVSPVIARVFTPLVLITLVVYLLAVLFTGKDPYNDREFLLVFNLLLIGVQALILFAIAEHSKHQGNKPYLLLALALVTVAVNGIALSAIVFRISEWGITPNRLAVLGGNILMLTGLLLVTRALFKALRHGSSEGVERSITSYLPVYAAWTVVVVFLFPLFFGYR